MTDHPNKVDHVAENAAKPSMVPPGYAQRQSDGAWYYVGDPPAPHVTPGELLILRGLHLMIRTTFAPSDLELSSKHFVKLQADIGPWLSDYARVIDVQLGSHPVIIPDTDPDPDANGALTR